MKKCPDSSKSNGSRVIHCAIAIFLVQIILMVLTIFAIMSDNMFAAEIIGWQIFNMAMILMLIYLYKKDKNIIEINRVGGINSGATADRRKLRFRMSEKAGSQLPPCRILPLQNCQDRSRIRSAPQP